MVKRPFFASIVCISGLLAGCQTQSQPNSISFPDLTPSIPPSELTLGWNGQKIHITDPVTIPADYIRTHYPAWAKAGYPSQWRVPLADGRVAVMAAGRVPVPTGFRFAVLGISVFRKDGTLQIQEQTDTGTPNHFSSWTVYELDGKTLATEVVCFGAPFTAWHITSYEAGKPVREYQVNQNMIEIEYAIHPDGTETQTHSHLVAARQASSPM